MSSNKCNAFAVLPFDESNELIVQQLFTTDILLNSIFIVFFVIESVVKANISSTITSKDVTPSELAIFLIKVPLAVFQTFIEPSNMSHTNTSSNTLSESFVSFLIPNHVLAKLILVKKPIFLLINIQIYKFKLKLNLY